MIKEMMQQVVKGRDLSEEDMIGVMDEIMEGKATDAQIGAFITALRMKGETIDEITGAARVMRAKATPIEVAGDVIDMDRDEINVDQETIVDTCGTGGDGTNTFNVSTTTAFVVAGGGLTVAKHGNRSVSSQCGSADVLEALGVSIRHGLTGCNIVHEPHSQNTLGGRLVDDIGNDYLGRVRVHSRHAPDTLCLRAVIELLEQSLFHFFPDRLEVDVGNQAYQVSQQDFEILQVCLDHSVGLRVLNLDGNFPAIPQDAAVNLADGRRGKSVGLQRIE